MWLGDKLQKIRNNINLSGERKSNLLSGLLRKIDAREMLRSRESERRINKGPILITNPFKKMPAFAAILVAALLSGGTSFAAQNSLPGDVLYPVKVGFNEKIAEAVQFTPQGKATIESQIAAARLDEAAKLASQNRLSDNWKNSLQASFEAHANTAQKTIAAIQSTGDAATAVSLASDLEASLRARHGVINQLDGSSTVVISQAIADTVKVRQDAENGITSAAGQDPQGAKNSADGKLNAAQNAINSAGNYVGNLSLNTSTISDAQAKLSDAQNIFSQAEAKLTTGDYSGAFNQAQEAIRAAQEVKISTNLQTNLNLKGPYSVTGVGGSDEGGNGIENESSANSIPATGSSVQSGNAATVNQGDDGERTSGKDILTPTNSTSTSTPFKVNVRGDDGGGE